MSPCPEGDHLGVQACVQVHPANQADGWRVSSNYSKFNLKRRIRESQKNFEKQMSISSQRPVAQSVARCVIFQRKSSAEKNDLRETNFIFLQTLHILSRFDGRAWFVKLLLLWITTRSR